MIPKVTKKATDAGGLMAYLAGPGHRGEHEHQRVLGGNTADPGPLTPATARDVADDLRAVHLAHGPGQGGMVTWHCSLSLRADVGDLPDAQWRTIAEGFLTKLGFLDPEQADTRYAVVAHGRSVNGNAHVHIVSTLRREDGTLVNTWQDFTRAQRACAELAAEHGLPIVAGQQRNATPAPRALPRLDVERARRHPDVPLDRMQAAPAMRAARALCTSEADFVARLRADGWTVRPQMKGEQVVGYSVGRGQFADAASRIARDLSLPALRAGWAHDSAASRAEARAVWGDPEAPVAAPTSVPTPTPEAVTAALQDVGARLRTTTSGSEFAALSADLAGTAAVAATVTEGPESALWSARSADVGRAAQVRWAPAREHHHDGLRSAAMVLASSSMSAEAKAAAAAILAAVAALVLLHQARRAQARTDDLPRPARPLTAAQRAERARVAAVAHTAAAAYRATGSARWQPSDPGGVPAAERIQPRQASQLGDLGASAEQIRRLSGEQADAVLRRAAGDGVTLSGRPGNSVTPRPGPDTLGRRR